jgi:DNA-binding transcriptional ArsR family regulator
MISGKDLLERLLSSEAKGEMLTLFHKNPGLIDTIDGIGRRVGKSKEQIEVDVKDFVEMGILKAIKAGKLTLYSLNAQRDQEIQASLAEYFGGLKA